MSNKRTAVRCPDCDVGLNYHGDKLIHPKDPDEAHLSDAQLGGILIEGRSCPECGDSTSRLPDGARR